MNLIRKRPLLASLTLALTLLAGIARPGPAHAASASAAAADPALLPIEKAFDFKSLVPEVNVNLPRFLIQDALSEFSGTNDPLAATGVPLAELVKDVKYIRVVVLDVDKSRKAEVAKGVGVLRKALEAQWTPIVAVPGENVGIYVLGDPSGDAMAGLALLVHDDGDFVFANISGKVPIGKLLKIASQFEKLPKDFLEKLAGAEAAKSGGGGSTNTPASKPEPAAKP